jgi:hypothetical protein
MLRRLLTASTAGCILWLALSASAFGQYGGGTGMGTTGTGGGVYTAPKGGYKSSTGIAIGAAAAAGVGVAYLALRHRGGVVGCVEQSSDGSKLMNERDKNTYALLASKDVVLTPGERVALAGKKAKDDSGKLTFEATRVAKDYGSCRQ